MTRLLRHLTILLVAGIVAAACSGGDISGDQGRLEVDGSATLTSASGDIEVVTDAATLELGDVVVVDAGTATLELADGARYALRAGADGADGTELTMALPPELGAGSVLVEDGFPAAVALDRVVLTAQGTAAVDATERRARAYAGRSRLSGLGSLTELEGLRSVLLATSAEPEPITYDGADPWDRRFLGEAIAFGERLEALARGYTSELQPGLGRSASFYESVIPALREEREYNDRLLEADRDPGETLVGAAIAVQSRRGNFRDVWLDVFAFRDAGAAWGLVALDQGVSSAPVLDTIELAVAESPLSGDPRPSTTTSTTAPTTTSSTVVGSSTTTTTTSTTTTTAPPGPGGVLDPVLDPIQQIVEDLLDGIGLG